MGNTKKKTKSKRDKKHQHDKKPKRPRRDQVATPPASETSYSQESSDEDTYRDPSYLYVTPRPVSSGAPHQGIQHHNQHQHHHPQKQPEEQHIDDQASTTTSPSSSSFSLPRLEMLSQNDPEYCAIHAMVERTGLAGAVLDMQQQLSQFPSSPFSFTQASSSPQPPALTSPTTADPMQALQQRGFSLVHAFPPLQEEGMHDDRGDKDDDDTKAAEGKRDRNRRQPPPPIFILPTHSALVTRPSLLKCNIVYNARWRCFLCIHPRCCKIVGAASLESHLAATIHRSYQLHTTKQGKNTAVDEALSLCTALNLQADEDTKRAVARVYNELGSTLQLRAPPVEGLPIYQGYCCASCPDKPHVYDSPRTLRQGHTNLKHGGERKPASALVYYQCLNEDNDCLIDKVRPRVVVLPPYAAVMAAAAAGGHLEGNAGHQDTHTEESADFAQAVVSSRLAPRVLVANARTGTTTPALATTLAQPEERRHTDLLLNKLGFLHLFGDATSTYVVPLWEATAPAGKCPWSSAALLHIEFLLSDLVSFYMEKGINDRVMQCASFVLRGAIGGVHDEDCREEGGGRGTRRHFVSVDRSTIAKYSSDVKRLILMVVRQALYWHRLRQTIVEEDEVKRLDAFHGSLPDLPHDVKMAVDRVLRVLVEWATTQDPEFHPGANAAGTQGTTAGTRGQVYTTAIQQFAAADVESARSLLQVLHELASVLFFRAYPPEDPPLLCPVQRFLLGASYTPQTGFALLDHLYGACSSLKFFSKGTAFFYVTPPWPRLGENGGIGSVMPFLKPDGFVDKDKMTVSPFRLVFELGRYVRALSQSRPPVPKVFVAPGGLDKKVLLLGDKSHRLEFDKVVAAVAATQQDILAEMEILLEGVPAAVKSRLHLAKDLAGVTPSAQPYKVVSNMQSRLIGYNFTRDAEAEELRVVSAQVTQAIELHRRWRVNGKFVRADSTWEWVQRVDNVMRIFLFRNHLASGPPPRAPEHAAVQLARTERCPHQVHILHPIHTPGHTALITPMHNKNNQLVITLRIIPRTLDPFASRFLIDYMSVIRPLYEFILLHERGDGAVDEAALYLCNGRRLSDEQVRSAIEEGFSSRGLPGITISSYRQGVSLWTREFIPSLLEEHDALAKLPRKVVQFYKNLTADKASDWEEAGDHLFDLLGGHSTHTALSAYGRNDHDHSILTASELYEYMKVCQVWQRMYGCDEGAFSRLRQGMEERVQAFISSAGGTTAGAAGRGEGGIVASGATTPSTAGTTTTLVATSSTTSSVGVVAGPTATSQVPSGFSFASAVPLEQQGLILGTLGTLLGTTEPHFRCQAQAEAFYAMFQVRKNLLVVLPTGAGKSLLFLLLAKLVWRRQFVVVVVPLKGLAEDLVRRGKKMGVQAWGWQEFVGLWEQDQESLTGGLLVLQHELCHGQERFVGFLSSASQRGRLRAVIFDEVHLFHLYGTSFRKEDLITPLLLPVDIPLIALSATLPPSMEGRVAHHLRLEDGVFERVCRSPTLAKHMRYEVHCENPFANAETSFLRQLDRVSAEYLLPPATAKGGGNEGGEGKVVSSVVAADPLGVLAAQPLRPKGKGIVFFNNKKTLATMAAIVKELRGKTMRVYTFHGLGRETEGDGGRRLAAEEERSQSMAAFLNNTEGGEAVDWLFATIAGGVGIDMRGVRAVVVYEWCYSQLELYQMFGRCRAPENASWPSLGLVLTSSPAINKLKTRLALDREAPLQLNDTEEDRHVRLRGMEAHLHFLQAALAGSHEAPESRQCFRHALESFNSGVGVSCISAGGQLCAVCSDIVVNATHSVGLQEATPPPHAHTAVVQVQQQEQHSLLQHQSMQPGHRHLRPPKPQEQPQQRNDKDTQRPHQQTATGTTNISICSFPHVPSGGGGGGHLDGGTQAVLAGIAPYRPNVLSQRPPLKDAAPRPWLAGPASASVHIPAAAATSASSSTTPIPSSGLGGAAPPAVLAPVASVPMQRSTHARVDRCLAILKAAGEETNFLRACLHCLAVTGYKWGLPGDDPSRNPHNTSTLSYRQFVRACPQFQAGGLFHNKCAACLQPVHANPAMCGARNKEGWHQQARSGADCCHCCQLKDHACFASTDFHAPPTYGYGPPKQERTSGGGLQVVQSARKGCKLAGTDMYIVTAVTLWGFKHELLHFLLRRSHTYHAAWHSTFGGDASKQYGVDLLPLPVFYRWLYGYWFSGGGQVTPIRNCHALFILFIRVTNCGKQRLPASTGQLAWIEDALDIHLDG